MVLPFHHTFEPLHGGETQRRLDDSYLVDNDGNAYPSYSLAWRYLGMFIDCDNNRRQLEDGDNACQRKVLWAAYHDSDYNGGSIGEYSFFNRDTDSWDSSTCRPKWNPLKRCQRLNCHEKKTKLDLVGVYKETDGLYDWTEQLFKHQGYCLWDGDKEDDEDGSGDGDSKDDDGNVSSDYNFMQNVRQNWIYECTELEYYDEYGNTLYIDTKPLSGGNMTYGVYTDASCSTESSLTWSDISQNNGDYISADYIDRWNDLLSDYKICQPCRAYNRVSTSEEGSNDSEDSDSGDNNEDDYSNNDGEGSNEQWGFDCYDDAGYQNCNQCYKFESQTDMEQASTDDLELATEQGTILAVTVDGVMYGSGYYEVPGHKLHVFKRSLIELLSAMAFIGLTYCFYTKVGKYRIRNWYKQWKKPVKRKRRFRRPTGNKDMKEELTDATASDEEDLPSNSDSSARNKNELNHSELIEQITQRNATIAQQDKLIQQLKRKLASIQSVPVVRGSPTIDEESSKGQASFHKDGEWQHFNEGKWQKSPSRLPSKKPSKKL